MTLNFIDQTKGRGKNCSNIEKTTNYYLKKGFYFIERNYWDVTTG